MMNIHFYKAVLLVSLILNLAISIPALIILCASANIRLELYQTIARKINNPKVALVGDSLTRGGGIWAYRFKRLPFDTLNYGQDGLTTDQLSQIIVGMNVVPPMVLIMAGANDADKTVAGAYRSFHNYQLALTQLQARGAKPIIQLTLYRQNDPNPDFVDTLNQLLVNYAKLHHLQIVDLNPLLARERSLLSQYTTDGLHLTEDAYRIWASQVRPLLHPE